MITICVIADKEYYNFHVTLSTPMNTTDLILSIGTCSFFTQWYLQYSLGVEAQCIYLITFSSQYIVVHLEHTHFVLAFREELFSVHPFCFFRPETHWSELSTYYKHS